MTISVVSNHISCFLILLVGWESINIKFDALTFQCLKLGAEESIDFCNFVLDFLPASFTADQVDISLLLVKLCRITNIDVVSFKLLLAAFHLIFLNLFIISDLLLYLI